MSGKLDDDLRAAARARPARGRSTASGGRAPSGRSLATSPDDPLPTTLYLDGRLALVDDMLHYFDRASMAHSLEVRVPFLDHQVVEYCATIPAGLKVTAARRRKPCSSRRRAGSYPTGSSTSRRSASSATPSTPGSRRRLAARSPTTSSARAPPTRSSSTEATVERLVAPARDGSAPGDEHLAALDPDPRDLALELPPAGSRADRDGPGARSPHAMSADLSRTRSSPRSATRSRTCHGWLACIESQTVAPTRWIIVDTGSTDGTVELVDGLVAEQEWIRALCARREARAAPRRTDRARDPSRLRELDETPPDIVVKLDADVSFEPDYFARLAGRVRRDPHLGIASGSCYELEGDGLEPAASSAATPSGEQRAPTGSAACRRSCRSRRDGLGRDRRAEGQHERLANAILLDLPFHHHRREGERDGRGAAWASAGPGSYYMGYRPCSSFCERSTTRERSRRRSR